MYGFHSTENLSDEAFPVAVVLRNSWKYFQFYHPKGGLFDLCKTFKFSYGNTIGNF